MYSVEIKVRFRYGHRLMPPYKGKCNNPHGESCTSIFIFEKDKLDKCGLLLDFGVVKERIREITDTKYDHAFLYKRGDVVGKILTTYKFKTFEMRDNPTAENIAKMLYDEVKEIFPELKKVGVVEGYNDSVAWYEEDKIIEVVIPIEINEEVNNLVEEEIK